MNSITLDDLDREEQDLIQRRDAYVQEANANIAAFNGAIQQLQVFRARLTKPQAVEAPRQRGKPAPKVKETPVANEVVPPPESLTTPA